MVMRLLDLFSGIGGFSYAAEKLVGGFETIAFCEQEEFCQQVLRKHWKDVPIYDDVRTINASRLGRVDIVCGGFPCQAVSQAGLQKATEDDRWLWDEMLRIIQDCKPRWVVGENVTGLVNINEGFLFEQVQTDLEKEGYSVQSFVIPAAGKNAPHLRNRVWIIAHSNGNCQSNESKHGGKKFMDEYRGEQIDLWQLIENKSLSNSDKWESGSGNEPKSNEEKQFKSSTDNTNKRGSLADSNSNGDSITGSNQTIQGSSRPGETNERGSGDNVGREFESSKDGQMDSKKQHDVTNSIGIRRSKINNENGNSQESCTKERTTRQHNRICGNVSNSTSEGEWKETRDMEKSSERMERKGSEPTIGTFSSSSNVSNSIGQRRCGGETRRKDAEDVGERSSSEEHWRGDSQRGMGYMADGLSEALSGHFSREPKDIPRVQQNQKDRAKKLKALGNSIVPQVAAELLYAIKIADEETDEDL